MRSLVQTEQRTSSISSFNAGSFIVCAKKILSKVPESSIIRSELSLSLLIFKKTLSSLGKSSFSDLEDNLEGDSSEPEKSLGEPRGPCNCQLVCSSFIGASFSEEITEDSRSRKSLLASIFSASWRNSSSVIARADPFCVIVSNCMSILMFAELQDISHFCARSSICSISLWRSARLSSTSLR